MRCDECEEMVEELDMCARPACNDMRKLCPDCLFEHETEHEEKDGGGAGDGSDVSWADEP